MFVGCRSPCKLRFSWFFMDIQNITSQGSGLVDICFSSQPGCVQNIDSLNNMNCTGLLYTWIFFLLNKYPQASHLQIQPTVDQNEHMWEGWLKLYILRFLTVGWAEGGVGTPNLCVVDGSTVVKNTIDKLQWNKKCSNNPKKRQGRQNRETKNRGNKTQIKR